MRLCGILILRFPAATQVPGRHQNLARTVRREAYVRSEFRQAQICRFLSILHLRNKLKEFS